MIIDLFFSRRIENFHIVLRPCRYRMSQLENKHLKYLKLGSGSNPELTTLWNWQLRDKINEFVLPRRPDFQLE